jgi:hypothetical protein
MHLEEGEIPILTIDILASGAGEFGKRRPLGRKDEVVGSLIGGLPIATDQNPTLELRRMDPWPRDPSPAIPPQPL